jgi:two-component system LytT family response regulator
MIEYVVLGSVKVPVKEIIVIKGEGNYSNIFTQDGKRILTCRTLKYFATMLAEYQFIRPSKSALINPDSIEHIDFKSQKAIRLVNGDVIPISRRNVRPLREQFQA